MSVPIFINNYIFFNLQNCRLIWVLQCVNFIITVYIKVNQMKVRKMWIKFLRSTKVNGFIKLIASSLLSSKVRLTHINMATSLSTYSNEEVRTQSTRWKLFLERLNFKVLLHRPSLLGVGPTWLSSVWSSTAASWWSKVTDEHKGAKRGAPMAEKSEQFFFLTSIQALVLKWRKFKARFFKCRYYFSCSKWMFSIIHIF